MNTNLNFNITLSGKSTCNRYLKKEDRENFAEGQQDKIYGIGDKRSRGERRELYELLWALGSEVKDVIKVKEVPEAEKKKEGH